jgi:hypothetical protein
VTFNAFTVASRNMRGTVRLPADGLMRDNVFHFVVSPSEPVHAMVIDRSGAEREGLFLTRALAISESPRVELLTRTPATVTDADLRQSAVVLVNDVQMPDELADRLARFVTAGGGLFIAAGPHATWPAHAADTVPGLPGDPVDRTMTRRRGSAVSNTATRSSSSSARRGPATTPRPASTATAACRSRPARFSRGSTTARRR